MTEEKEKQKAKGNGFCLDDLAVDMSKAEEGVWCEIAEGFAIKVARIGHPRYKAYVAKLAKPHARRVRRDGLGSEMLLRDIQSKAVAKHILLDWRNLHDREGNVIEYSQAKALELLCDPQYSEFLDIVVEAATDQEAFRLDDIEDAAKN